MSRGFYFFITRRAAVLVGMSGTVRRYEQLKKMQHKQLTRRETTTSATTQNKNHHHYTQTNQISNIKFLSSFKHAPSTTPKHHHSHQTSLKYKKQRLPNSLMPGAPDDPSLHFGDRECRIHGMARNVERCEAANHYRSVTLPLISCDTTDTTPGEASMNTEELMKSIRKINIGMKHLLSRETELVSNTNANEWKLVGIIMDRVIFWTFFLLTCIASSCLLIILPMLKHNDII